MNLLSNRNKFFQVKECIRWLVFREIPFFSVFLLLSPPGLRPRSPSVILCCALPFNNTTMLKDRLLLIPTFYSTVANQSALLMLPFLLLTSHWSQVKLPFCCNVTETVSHAARLCWIRWDLDTWDLISDMTLHRRPFLSGLTLPSTLQRLHGAHQS